MNVRNWNFSYNKESLSIEKKQEIKQDILDTISLWIAIGLLWCSFLTILQEHFQKFIALDGGVVILLVLVNWIGYEWPKKYLKKLARCFWFVGVLIPVVYLGVHFEKVIDGIIQLTEIYLPHVNDYYNTNYYLQIANTGENFAVAFTALCMLIWCMVWILAYRCKRRALLGLFPLVALALELAVGLSPHGNGLLMLFFAEMILVIMGGTSIVRKTIVLACVGLSVFVTDVVFHEDIENLATREQKNSLIIWQNNLDADSFNPFKQLQLDFHANTENLNNNTPQYTGKVVLQMQTTSRPESTVYLKGFYATYYEDGTWRYDDSVFKQACSEAGKSQEEVSKEIFQMTYEKGKETQTNLNNIYNNNYTNDYIYGEDRKENVNSFRIRYTGTTGDVAYVPYFADYNSLDEKYTLFGDYLMKKNVFDKETTGASLNLDTGTYAWYTIDSELEDNKYDEDPFLNKLVSAYLQVPEDSKYISDAVKSVKAYFSYVSVSHPLVYANLVAAYLQDQMSYSLRLDNLPRGNDPIEYALTTSHEGYCMHFASAATLILREMGIPARYVSGYAVSPERFSYDMESDMFKADVGDYMAHAWVEIYLDNVGWVPVEVTPGSSLEGVPSEIQIQQWEEMSNRRRQELANREDVFNSEDVDDPIENTENDSQTEEPTEDTEQDTQVDSEIESTEDDQPGTDNKPGNGKINGEFVWTLIALLGLSVMIYVGGKRGIYYYEKVLEKEVDNNQTRKVVKRINRRLYRRLRLMDMRRWFGKKWSDEEYKQALIESFTDIKESDWERFMGIVKKNHYSHETIMLEEMEFCYDCYKKAKVFHWNRN